MVTTDEQGFSLEFRVHLLYLSAPRECFEPSVSANLQSFGVQSLAVQSSQLLLQWALGVEAGVNADKPAWRKIHWRVMHPRQPSQELLVRLRHRADEGFARLVCNSIRHAIACECSPCVVYIGVFVATPSAALVMHATFDSWRPVPGGVFWILRSI